MTRAAARTTGDGLDVARSLPPGPSPEAPLSPHVRPARVDVAELVAVLERAYGLGRWLSWCRTTEGVSNTSWFVETESGSVVLRRSSPRKTVASAELECALIDRLLEHGYPAPPVLRTREGEILAEVDGVIHMVMRRLPGTAYDGDARAHRVAAARGLARFHTISATSPVAAPRHGSAALATLGPLGQQGVLAAVEVVAPLLEGDAAAQARGDARFLVGEMDRLHRDVGERQPDLTSVVVHGSYAPTSLLLTGGRLSAVLDFDRAAPDLLGLDLAYALDALCRAGAVRRAAVGLDVRVFRELLRHYQGEAPVSSADLDAVPELLRAQRLVKVARKCQHLVAKQATVPRRVDHARDLTALLQIERARIRWLLEDFPAVPHRRSSRSSP